MRGACSWSALLLQISDTNSLHWLQSAQVSCLGLCGPETRPWSAGTSLLALMECNADDRKTLFHPFSLVGCQCNSAWALMLCQLNRVGLPDQPSPGISATALCARPGHWGMKGILILTALIIPTFAAVFIRCIKMLMIPYHAVCCVAQGPEGCLPLPGSHSQLG